MPDVFSALANPVRRQILAALRDGPRAVNDLASMFELGRPAVSEHLQVLRKAQLVREEPRGQQRFYHLEAVPLAEVDAWLHPFERYWRARMRDLGSVLDDLAADDAPAPTAASARPTTDIGKNTTA
ncbi:winged helix-turn-helix transcriptional regulator [Planctomonas sp. JC2975]|uniref:ArsR/SmtB family transcription factor n=1 Tax=Planctomonas sp. JC2975 TaxID=2729626 RepID=UPI001474E7D6|nr:metalloregulator ArsR/SmtB family transcription factor [Planctomonas sp. JC2975]NNC12505.1 winged helix-turn-helix transcriptional regulator [Planctomonas sp. JC2975]